MKEVIQQRARELGFDACRVTTAEPPLHAREFQQWLADGRHGEMAWLDRSAGKRVQPRHVLPGANSIITLAVSYARNERPPSGPGTGAEEAAGARRGAGIVARYARYSDYHDVMSGRLRALAEFIDGLEGSQARSLWYVDTGPLLERDLARRAGLGFIGKHTNLISRRLGNWFFLAEIITTARLDPDAPEKNRCGSCSSCIEACPTRAITAPFQLDARRCISYLTIELKGAIPEEFRPAIGNRIYGCDDCLAVCPWNRFAREGSMMREHVRADLDQPQLLELLALDGPEFKKRFAGTPMLRTRRRGLLRNVCVALGNIGDQTVLPHLDRAARDPEPLIAEHARWAIGRVQRRLRERDEERTARVS